MFVFGLYVNGKRGRTGKGDGFNFLKGTDLILEKGAYLILRNLSGKRGRGKRGRGKKGTDLIFLGKEGRSFSTCYAGISTEGGFMPRMGRVVLPNYPHHIVQRGHNRQVVFAETGDFQRYLYDLRELKAVFGVKVYAYCLMDNHVHLLLAPGESVAGLGQLMKALAARMTRYRNKLEGRSGTLWEG
ncbi:transposase, partial [Pseudomonas gingeri]|uniref:transposase n=1 Tax=Pseudomonas gingeri TaxID=117681 RepID=UPI00210AD2F6